jgi:sugar phosphate isomerase/epimerase
MPREVLHDKDFRVTLNLLKKYGFYGVELNITDFDSISPEEMISYLGEFDLKLTMIATGVYANQNRLSLSSKNETIRKQSMEQLKKILEYAHKAKSGVICGLIKGGPNESMEEAKVQMGVSLKELSAIELVGMVDVYLEATNHYETTLVNTVGEGVNFSIQADNCVKILPDTYHMNIEEVNMTAAIVKYIKYFNNIHISDNNRYFPGFGSIDFFTVFSLLRGLNYKGTMSIEGRCLGKLHEDIIKSANYIYSVSQRL